MSSGALYCYPGDLASGGSSPVYEVKVRATSIGPVTATATASGSKVIPTSTGTQYEPVGGEASQGTTVNGMPLVGALIADSEDQVRHGETYSYEIGVRNDSSEPVLGARVSMPRL